MLIESVVKLGARPVISEPGTSTDMIVELAAEIIVEAALGQAVEELARQCAEAIAAREPSECALYLCRCRSEQRRQGWPHRRRQALDGGELSHLAKIGASTALPGVSVHSAGKGGGDIHQARLVGHLKPEAPQVFSERRAACRKRNLSQQPKGVKEGRIVRGARKARLGRFRGKACHSGNVGTEAQLFDDLLPLPGFRQNA